VPRRLRPPLDLGSLDSTSVHVRPDGYRQVDLDLGPRLGRTGSHLTIVLDHRPGRAVPPTAEPRTIGGVEGRILVIEVTDPDGTVCRLDWDERPVTGPGGRWVADPWPLFDHARLRTTVAHVLGAIGPGRPSELGNRLTRYRFAIRELAEKYPPDAIPQREVADRVPNGDERKLRDDIAEWWAATHPGERVPPSRAGGAWRPFVEDALGVRVN
jgi:hypothetical protein